MKSMRRSIGRVIRALGIRRRHSHGHAYITETDSLALSDGWKDPRLPKRQRRVYDRALDDMRSGNSPRSFQVAAEATRLSGILAPSILEIGSGSGYYSEVFLHMVSAKASYVGLDYSLPMVSLAKAKYGPVSRFCVGDATSLPFRSGSFDVAFSGGVLLHVRDFRRAIVETRRVARYWAVFHVIPCVVSSDTSLVKKSAYGVEVMEVIFNQGELCSAFEECGLRMRERFVLEAYPVGLLQEKAHLLTFACEVVQ